MFHPTLFLFSLTILASILLVIINIRLFNFSLRTKQSFKILCAIFILSLFIRFLYIFIFPFASGYDINSFIWAGNKVFNKQDIYWGLKVREKYAFMPAFGMLVACFIHISSYTYIPVVAFIKIISSIFDSFISVLIAKKMNSAKYGLLYATTPIAVIVSSCLGQFDSIPLFFLLLSLILSSENKQYLSAFLLGAAIMFKPWPIIFLPIILAGGQPLDKAIRLLSTCIVPLLSILVYKMVVPSGNILTMVGAIVLYESAYGWWGPSILFQYLAQYTHHRKIILIPTYFSKIFTLTVILFLYKKLTRKNTFHIAKLIILTIYIFSFGLSIHYLLWIVPFLMITKDKYLKQYLLFTGLFTILISIYILDYNFQLPSAPGWIKDTASFILWGFFVFWYKHLALRNQRSSSKLHLE